MVVILAAMSTGGCTKASPDAGHEAVLVRKPWIFGHGGVDKTPVSTGLAWIALSTSAMDVNMQPEQIHVKFDDLMSRDGVPLDFDAVIRVKVSDSVTLIERFGPQWIENNLLAEFSNRVRQAVRKHGLNETAISTTAIEAIDTEVTQAMTAYIKESGLPIHLIAVTVGKANPPDSIKHQRVETAAQEQRINTEKQRKLAEDQRKDAELARAAADNAYREAMRLSPEQFLVLEGINAQKEICMRGGCTFVTPGISVLAGSK